MLGVRRQFLIEKIIGVNSLTSTFCFKAYCQQTSLMCSDRKASDGNSFHERDRPCLQLKLPSLSLSLYLVYLLDHALCSRENIQMFRRTSFCSVISRILRMVRQDVFVPIVRKVAIVAPRLPVAWSVPWQQGHAHLASPRKQISDGSEFCNAQTWFAGFCRYILVKIACCYFKTFQNRKTVQFWLTIHELEMTQCPPQHPL